MKIIKNNYYGWFAIFFCAAFPSIILLFQVSWSGDKLINFFPDDAFYYLQTAFNYTQMGEPSFDGVNQTTGFHPLQMLLAILGMEIFDKQNSLIAFFLFNVLAINISIIFFLNTLKVKPEVIALTSISAIGFLNIHILASGAMESGLVAIFSSLLISQLLLMDRLDCELSNGKFFLLGATAGLLILSRLDMIIVIFPLAIFFLWQIFKNKNYRQLIIALIGFCIPLLPYFFWIYQLQGSFAPISSIAKYSRIKADFDGVMTTMTGNQFVGYLILSLIFILPLAGLIVMKVNKHSSKFLVSAIALSSLVYLGYIFFIAHEAYRWYLTYPLNIASFFMIYILTSLGSITTKLSKKVGYCVIIPAMVFTLNLAMIEKLYFMDTVSSSLLQMVKSVNKLIPKNSKIATHDAGIVGYFSNSSVHNLDGLANSRANWESYLNKGDILGYVKEYHIEYLLLKNPVFEDLVNLNKSSNVEFDHEIIAEYKVLRMSDMKLIKLTEK
jgi:hypothetical protein